MRTVLKLSLISFVCIAFLLGVLFLNTYYKNLNLFVINLFITIVGYVILIMFSYKCQFSFLRLTFITVLFQFFAITLLTQLYISNSGLPFSFTAIDSLAYDSWARDYINLPFRESLRLLAAELPIDDLGFPVYLSVIYRLSPDPIFSRYFMIVIIVVTAIFIYKIGLFFLSKKFAYISALSMSLSGYSVLYASNGLKELFMLLILMMAFYYFLLFITTNNIRQLILSVLVSFMLVFFRIPLIFFFLITIAITLLLVSRKKPILIQLLFVIIVISLYLLYRYYSLEITRFTDISSEDAVNRTSSFVGQTGYFTVFVSFIAGLIGPLPTLFPKYGKEDVFYIGGTLILRVFLGGYIIATIIYAVKKRKQYIYPLIIYSLLTIFSLFLISEVFEFRFHIPHFPLLLILGFYGIENQLLTKRVQFFTSIIFILAILYWNFGRI